MKPTAYIETSVISYLTARQSNNIHSISRQNITADWWDTQRSKFNLVISDFVLAEARLGHPEAAARRMLALQQITLLDTSTDVMALDLALIERHALPSKAEIDAYHVAIAAVNGIQYLLTWNCTHIANAYTRPKIEATCKALGYEPPVICTPEELMEDEPCR